MSQLGHTGRTVLCTCPQSQGRPKNWQTSLVPEGCITDLAGAGNHSSARLIAVGGGEGAFMGGERKLWSTSWYHVRVMTMIGHIIRWQTHRILNLFQTTTYVVIVSFGQLRSVRIVQISPGWLGWADSQLLVLPNCFCGISKPWYSPHHVFRRLSLSPWDERSGISRCFTCDEL